MVKVVEIVENKDCSKPLTSWDEAYALRDRLQEASLRTGEDLTERRYGVRNC